jgi:hypothetical protein
MEEAAATWGEGESALFDDGDGQEVGLVPEFAPESILPTAKAYLDRQCLLALAASALALKNFGVNSGNVSVGVSFGTARGPSATAARFASDCMEKGLRLARPMLFPHTYANAAASLASIEWGLRGHHANFAGGANASTLAIVSAVDAIRSGRCDAMVAGGAEAIAPDSRENGAGEGAAVFALEREPDGECSPDMLCHITGAWVCGVGDLAFAVRSAGLSPADMAAAYVPRSLEDAFRCMDGFGGRVVVPSRMYGDTTGASGAMALAAALLDAPAGPFVVATSDETGTVVALVCEL